ncbi:MULTISPECIES: carbohydrate ABC transporter permease [Martelella]|uniref:Trehalose transport system permease protein SugA n=1 Tax=Martelella mediterranea DSM 17316 TaxID=1122214 RepID=A0A1U9Z9U7_9HYPH|nr:sugar ABC transporter permease [Martelella mediterranea]AQZ54436.1 Trehalose transport system permease protein SugA [Martelella mediterranea DSM 17316]
MSVRPNTPAAVQSLPGRGASRDHTDWSSSRGLLFLLLIAPSVLLLAALNAYPVFYAVVQSVRDGTLISAGEFVGLRNFTKVLGSEDFWHAVRFTLIFTLSGVAGSWVVGMALALALNARIYGGGTVKVLLLLPWVVPVVVSSMAWNWLVATPDSPLPVFARMLGFATPLFLANPTLAAITVCVFKVWCSFPFMMLMMSAALSAIDRSIYEASAIDGATGIQQLRHITLPLTARTTYISWILMTIFCVNDFPTIYLLTAGGPIDATTSLIVLAYRTVFQNFQTGPGVAIALMMTTAMVLISLALFRQIRKAGGKA